MMLLTIIVQFTLFFFRRNLGGKLGLDVSAQLNAEYMADIAKYSLNELKVRFGDKTG